MTDTTLPAVSREWHLASRPVGWPKPEDFAFVEAEVPQPGEGRSSSGTSTSPWTRTCVAA